MNTKTIPTAKRPMKTRAGTWAAAALAVIFGALAWHYTGPEVEFERRRIARTLSNRPLQYVLVLPEHSREIPARSRPAVVAIPPYSIPPEAMEIICIELARRGAACAIPDFFGNTKEESRQRMGANSLLVLTGDVLSVISELRALPFVNPDKIGACGHSVGGTVTVLAGLEDPRLRAAVPIGMFAEYFHLPQNLLFLSGLYDEIHSPVGLLDNLTESGITLSDKTIRGLAEGAVRVPQNRQTYGSFHDGSARQVSIMPATDHFIETFDPFLIRELMTWYAQALDHPELARGELREWRRRVAAFLFAAAAGILYFMAAGPALEDFARRNAPRRPEWIIVRVPALGLAAALVLLYAAAQAWAPQRAVMVDLMVVLAAAHELVSHRLRGQFTHPGRSSFRLFRSAGLILVALAAGVIVSFGLACLPYFYVFPEMAAWYPVFAFNMAVLFPLQVWGRVRPVLFAGLPAAADPTLVFYVLAVTVIAAPGSLARVAETFARELSITVRSRLRPLMARPASDAHTDVPAEARVTPLKAALAAVLIVILFLIGYRRVQEGMLTWETGRMALASILRFAVLPFIIAAAIVRARAFRKIARLD